MANLSVSSKIEADPVVSTDSVPLAINEICISHLSTPDVSNIELSKRMALLELENERLRGDLENTRIELNATIAANQGLKGKITELYVTVQTVVQEKQKLYNTLTDTKNSLSATESSAKWYQSQVHGLQASKKTMQVEIDTYQSILRQRQQTIVEINTKYKELSEEYVNLLHRYQKERQDMEEEIRSIRSQSKANSVSDISEMSISSIDVSARLEATEDELCDTRAELKALEQRLLGTEVSKMSMEDALNRQCILISCMEKNIQKCEIEKNETANMLHKMQFEIQKLKTENEGLQTNLISSNQEQSGIENAILQVRVQQSKMIQQYKSLKIKYAEAEKKLKCMDAIVQENKKLKTLSHEANSLLCRRPREEKSKAKCIDRKTCDQWLCKEFSDLQNKTDVSLQEYLKQVLIRNKDLKDQLKALTKTSDESIDEGYADSYITNFMSLDIPSPAPINPVLLTAASNILLKTKQFCEPIQSQLDDLNVKLNNLKEQCTV